VVIKPRGILIKIFGVLEACKPLTSCTARLDRTFTRADDDKLKAINRKDVRISRGPVEELKLQQ
jgi:hypothetical protein